jgi:hypothetical protein
MVETEHEGVELTSWAKAENRSRNLSTARSAAGSSVTGHGKGKVKGGGRDRCGLHRELLPLQPRVRPRAWTRVDGSCPRRPVFLQGSLDGSSNDVGVHDASHTDLL